MVWQRYSENGLASFSRRAAVCVSRESATQRYACMRTAGPRYWSWFHQYDGHDVEQHAQRMHCGQVRTKRGVRRCAGREGEGERGRGAHLVHAVELKAVLLRLEVLPAVGRLLGLEVRLDRLVLLVEPARNAQGSASESEGAESRGKGEDALGHVGHEVLDDIHCAHARRARQHAVHTQRAQGRKDEDALCGRG